MASKNPYYSGQPNDHFDGLRFFNPNHPDTDRSFADILRWKLRERAAAWPRSIPVLQTVPDAEVTGLRATIVGHADSDNISRASTDDSHSELPGSADAHS